MNWCYNVVTYDQWSYVTMPGILEVVFVALCEAIPIDRLLFGGSPEESAILQENCPLTAYLQVVVQDPVFVSDTMARATKQIDPKCLCLADTQFSHAGAQCAAVEPKDFGSPVTATYFPMGLLKYPDNIVSLNFIQRFLGCR
jgi:hypothetical protein